MPTVVTKAALPSGLTQLEMQVDDNYHANDLTIQGPIAPFSDMRVLPNAKLPNSPVGSVGV